MKLTNKLNLPQPIVDAVKNDSYSNGGADLSVTALLKPPKLLVLEQKYQHLIEEDASDRIWSLLGQVMHGVLERSSTTGISERRLTMKVDGLTISGQMDRYIDGVIEDYKFVTAYKFKNDGVPEEYEQQQNIYAELSRQNGHPVTELRIVGILRDWSKLEARREPSYPQTQVIVRKVDLWPSSKAQAFIKEKISNYKEALKELPECSETERWARPTKFAVMKVGAKKAVKLYDNESDAASHASTSPLLSVQHRPGESIRCAAYCAVSSFCTQYQEMARKKDEDVA